MGLHHLKLTEAQRAHLAFAVLCQVEDLEDCHEAHEPEVQEAIFCLHQVRVVLEALGKGAQS